MFAHNPRQSSDANHSIYAFHGITQFLGTSGCYTIACMGSRKQKIKSFRRTEMDMDNRTKMGERVATANVQPNEVFLYCQRRQRSLFVCAVRSAWHAMVWLRWTKKNTKGVIPKNLAK